MTPISHDPDTAQADIFLSLLLAETDGLLDHIAHAQTQVEQPQHQLSLLAEAS